MFAQDEPRFPYPKRIPEKNKRCSGLSRKFAAGIAAGERLILPESP